jgi:hypothetical protein
MLADTSVCDSERLPDTRTKLRVRTSSRSRTRDDRHAHDLAGHARLADAREPVCFVDPAQGRPAESADCSRNPISTRSGAAAGVLAVEAEANGASHQGGAALLGEDRAAEPLHGNPAAADQAHRCRRRPKAEARCRDQESRPQTADLRRAALPLGPDRCPPHSRSAVRPSGGSPSASGQSAICRFAPSSSCATATMPGQSGRLDGRDQSTMFSGAPRACAFPTRIVQERRRNVAAVRRKDRI